MNHCGGLLYQTGGCWPHGQPTQAYNEWSGFLSVILPPLFTVAGMALVWLWHSQCHVTGCFWPARRLTATNERACWLHHPHKRRSAADILAAHHARLKQQGGQP